MLRVARWIACLAFGSVVLVWSFHVRNATREMLVATEDGIARSNAVVLQGAIAHQPTNTVPVSIDHGATFSELLQRADVDAPTIYQIVQAARPAINFRRLNGDNKFCSSANHSDIESPLA